MYDEVLSADGCNWLTWRRVKPGDLVRNKCYNRNSLIVEKIEGHLSPDAQGIVISVALEGGFISDELNGVALTVMWSSAIEIARFHGAWHVAQ